jgi:hypothetical protein
MLGLLLVEHDDNNLPAPGIPEPRNAQDLARRYVWVPAAGVLCSFARRQVAASGNVFWYLKEVDDLSLQFLTRLHGQCMFALDSDGSTRPVCVPFCVHNCDEPVRFCRLFFSWGVVSWYCSAPWSTCLQSRFVAVKSMAVVYGELVRLIIRSGCSSSVVLSCLANIANACRCP